MTDDRRTIYFCTRCGECCRWPGYVRVTDAEIDAIAACLGIDVRRFLDRYTRLTEKRDGLSLIEKPDGSCVFLDTQGACRIQRVKPGQCRAFPNHWNFPGFRETCRAIAITVTSRQHHPEPLPEQVA